MFNFSVYQMEKYIIGQCNFLQAIERLKNKECDAIYGPQGGILVLDDNCLVYDHDKSGILFSADNYLGRWRLLKYKD